MNQKKWQIMLLTTVTFSVKYDSCVNKNKQVSNLMKSLLQYTKIKFS